jgi:hypothetical protein
MKVIWNLKSTTNQEFEHDEELWLMKWTGRILKSSKTSTIE